MSAWAGFAAAMAFLMAALVPALLRHTTPPSEHLDRVEGVLDGFGSFFVFILSGGALGFALSGGSNLFSPEDYSGTASYVVHGLPGVVLGGGTYAALVAFYLSKRRPR